MSWWSKLVAGPVVETAKGVADIVDRFVETPEEKAAAAIIKAKILAEPMKAQIALNSVEAGSRTFFISGWRPSVGWVCSAALAWHFIIYDFFVWLQINFFPNSVAPPVLSGTENLITILLGLLGLGAYRSFEKVTGVSK